MDFKTKGLVCLGIMISLVISSPAFAGVATQKVKSRLTNKGVSKARITFSDGARKKEVVTDAKGYARGFSLPFGHGAKVKITVEADGYIPSENSCAMPECLDQTTYYLSIKPIYATLEENIEGKWGSKSFAVYDSGKAYIAYGVLNVKRKSIRSYPGEWRREYLQPWGKWKGEHVVVDHDCNILAKNSTMKVIGRNPRVLKGNTRYSPDSTTVSYHSKSQTAVGMGIDGAGVKGINEFDKNRLVKLYISSTSLKTRLIGKWSVGVYYQDTFYIGELIVESNYSAALLLRYTRNGKRYFHDQACEVDISGDRLTLRGIKSALYEERGDVFSGQSGAVFSFSGKMNSHGEISGNLNNTSGKNGLLRMQRLVD